jgi:hypothetical protein
MQIHSVGIDLGKTTFHLVALGAAGNFTQRQLLAYTGNMQVSLIGLEACSGAHFLGRVLRMLGHECFNLKGHPVPVENSQARRWITKRRADYGTRRRI